MTSIPASILFVPGSAPDRFAKALMTPAGMICLDLEDAVAPQDKADARAQVIAHLASSFDPDRLCIRINRLASVDGCEDIAALAHLPSRPGAIMMPKVESPRDAELFSAALPRCPPIIALVESPRGVDAAAAIAREPAVDMLMFGSFDYAAEAGCSQAWEVLLPVRSRLVAAAAAAGKSLIDSPYADLADTDGNADESARARAMGCAGKAAIHPRMIEGIERAFVSDELELGQARAIVEAFYAAGGGAARIGGKLIERPVVLRMERLLDRSRNRVTGVR